MKLDQAVKEDLRKFLMTRNDELLHKVVVTSAYNLSEEEKKMLQEKLSLTSSYVSYKIDPDIIAGVVVKFGSKVIDISLKRQLENYKRILYENIR